MARNSVKTMVKILKGVCY